MILLIQSEFNLNDIIDSMVQVHKLFGWIKHLFRILDYYETNVWVS